MPLDNFPLARTSDPEELREALAQIYAEPILRPVKTARTLDASINLCQFGDTVLSYGRYGAAVNLEYPDVDHFVLLLATQGKARITRGNNSTLLTAGESLAISAHTGYDALYDDDYERLVLQMDKGALTRKLEALLGTTIDQPLRIEPRAELGNPAAHTLREYLPILADTLNAADPFLPVWWVSQTQQMVMVMFLLAHQHNYSSLLQREPADVAPSQVRLVEDYIEANWEQPLSLESLAEISGMSVFALFRAFKKSRGYSPMAFVSQLRARRRKEV